MIESLALALGKALVSFLFSQYLDAQDDVSIDGAPSWYEVKTQDQVCTFNYKPGGLESLALAKADAEKLMVKKIETILEIVISEHGAQAMNEQERQLIGNVKTDKNLPLFVKKNLHFHNIEYSETAQKTFLKACITKARLINYEQNRLTTLQNTLSHHRADEAFDELDKL